MVKFRVPDREIETIGYTLEEIAEALRVHPETVRKMLNSGEMPAKKIGREWRIEPEAIRQWLSTPNQDCVDED